MRLLTLFFLLLLLSSYKAELFAEWGLKTPEETLVELNKIMEHYEASTKDLEALPYEEIETLYQNLNLLQYQIKRHINDAESADPLNPSTERLEVIQSWAQAIQPYNRSLLETSFQTRPPGIYNALITESLGLLNYSYANDVFVTMARETLLNSNKMRPRLRAARLLFEHRKLEESDLPLLARMKSELKDSQKMEWSRAVARFGMADGLEFSEEILRIPIPLDIDERELFKYETQIKTALHPIRYLGEKAQHLVPLIEARLAEIKAINPAFSVSGSHMQYHIDVANGIKPKALFRARNGSGILGFDTNVSSSLSVKTVEEVIEESLAPKQAPERPVGAVTIEHVKETTEKPSNWWLWLIGLLVVVVGGFLVLRRKS